MRVWIAFAVFIACAVGMVSTAAAQSSQLNPIVAQSLFEEGRRLMDNGEYAEACTKFAESQRLDPSGGTLLNLALCREKEGKIATAWAAFKSALGVARKDGRQDRIDAAEQHIRAIEPHLPQLTMDVGGPAPDQQIKVGETVLGRELWGIAFPVDPGSYELSAEAPGRKRWQTNITIGLGEAKTALVPPLAPLVAPMAADPNAMTPAATAAPSKVTPNDAEPTADKGSGKSSAAGWVTAGAGVAAIGVGAVFGVMTFDKKAQSDAECPTDDTCTPRGVSLNDEANTFGWVANIAVGVGLAATAVGAYLILSGPSDGESARASGVDVALVLQPRPELGGGSLTMTGRW